MSASAPAQYDRALLLAVPATLFMLLLFIYPFIYGLMLSFTPKDGGHHLTNRSIVINH